MGTGTLRRGLTGSGDNGEIALHDAVEVLSLDLQGKFVVDTVIADLAKQIAGVTAAHRSPSAAIVMVYEILNCVSPVFAAELAAVDLE